MQKKVYSTSADNDHWKFSNFGEASEMSPLKEEFLASYSKQNF